MSEVLSVPKYVKALVAAGIGVSALTGCAQKSPQTWEVGVVCPDGGRAQVGGLDTDPYTYSENDARITVTCANKAGTDMGVTSLELTKGQGAVINSNKTYTDMIEIKYQDQFDGYTPEINMSTGTGLIMADNVKIESVAVTS